MSSQRPIMSHRSPAGQSRKGSRLETKVGPAPASPHIGVKRQRLLIVRVQTENGGWVVHPPFQKEEGGMSKMPFFLVLQWRRWRIEIRLIRR
ncbi:hypothetical protein [Azospirillum sp. TSH100]|uniref:hypothetical protein n=1 Tax=Azospirillum sp. TSH100 TaxID=652764 RepID=UPI0010AA9853|nr:hypothetical protein [Azospirillum sp. TSH100]QCG87300.1 hypothetical protein E6C72_05880 [Azospirillum sp. TSH100]